MSLVKPPIEELMQKVDSKFTLVTLSAQRARQINSYFSQLGDGIGAYVPPQVTSETRKPLSIALEEIAADKIVAGAHDAEQVPAALVAEPEADGEDPEEQEEQAEA